MSQLISKREKDMSLEEKIKLEVMRTLAAAKGYNLRAVKTDFNFRTGSNADKMAVQLMERFEIKFKDPKDAKIFWPEKELKWPSKPEVDALPPVQRKASAAEESAMNSAPGELAPDTAGKDIEDSLNDEIEKSKTNAESAKLKKENEDLQKKIKALEKKNAAPQKSKEKKGGKKDAGKKEEEEAPDDL